MVRNIAMVLAVALAAGSIALPVQAAAPKKQEQEKRELLGAVELAPQAPGSEALDDYLEELLPEILEDLSSEAEARGKGEPAEEAEVQAEGGTAEEPAEGSAEKAPETSEQQPQVYDQVKACYDYLVANVRYGSHMAGMGAKIGGTTCRSIYNRYGEVEGFGAVALTTRQGLCNAYASAFILMVRKIGLEARLAKGQTRARGGYYTYHEWAEVKIGDTFYLFDPQLEQDLPGKDAVFFKTYDEVPGRYRK